METRLAATLGSYQQGCSWAAGVEVSGVERQYDAHLNREVHAAGASQASDAVRSASLSRLESLFADSENSLGVLHDNFNAGLADLVNQPFDQAARDVTLQQAGALASKIDNTDQTLDRMRNDTDLHLGQLTQSVNADLKSLAAINARLAGVGGTTYSPNDLLDQRDAMIERINQSLKANAHINGDGSVSLFSAAGNALVLADDAGHVVTGARPTGRRAYEPDDVHRRRAGDLQRLDARRRRDRRGDGVSQP
ncbi:MAG: hypothetical protein R3E68_06885 [Burkholderiaceae bacterium]